MSKHTPEPWKINTDDDRDGWSIITSNSGSIIANVNGMTGPELVGGMPVDRVMPAEDNARRIVACVNACSGIRTEALEHRAHMLKAHDDAVAELTRQRDELLSALEGAVDCGMVPTSSAKEGGAAKYARQVVVADMIRDAISNAKGCEA